MRKAFVAALLLAQAVFPLSVVATVKSLAIVVKPVVGEVTYLVPPGASPLFWKPTAAQIEEALRADVFVNTVHWPFERQLAERRGAGNVPEPVPGTPGAALSKLGFAILRLPNGDLNPHGWWLYAPNAFLLMSQVSAHACEVEPSSCAKYVNSFIEELKKSREILEECFAGDKSAVVMLPGEQYIIYNFGVVTKFVVMEKGPASVSGLQMKKGVEALKDADMLVVSDVSSNTPAAKYMIAQAHRLGKPVVKVYLLNPPVETFHEYLKLTCEALSGEK